ncbi:MAG: zinc/iron-chelating domain-containing protein [Flavobacteriales bacterium]|nr:zinc/iron-chelating domain-containing protein [Flavobacteriales bacterium]|tara:strand:- start:4189 stop:4674 length:486 start_codon:yes stop_codon:yes gene_type:complete
MDLVYHKEQSRLKHKENTKLFKDLKKRKSKFLDKTIHHLHDAVFEYTNCLECANCCKTTSPLFTDKDINRIAKYLRIRPSVFTEMYLQVDEDRDYVLKSVPCLFLDKDNYCSIYKVRPKACREFPHTDRVKQRQLLKITQKNVEVCPAVFNIIERLKRVLE